MRDTLDERLVGLGTSLEAAAEVGSPALARSRGERLRTAHRRRMVAMTATSAAVAVVGVGGLVALRPGGQRGNPVSPGMSGSGTTASASIAAPSSLPPSKAPAGTTQSLTTPSGAAPTAIDGRTTAVIDPNLHEVTLVDRNGMIMKVLKVSAGDEAHPTRPGVYTVTAMHEQKMIESDPVGTTGYTLRATWVIELDGGGPMIYAAPWWNDSVFGTANRGHYNVGLRTTDAQFLYESLTVGDHVQVR